MQGIYTSDGHGFLCIHLRYFQINESVTVFFITFFLLTYADETVSIITGQMHKALILNGSESCIQCLISFQDVDKSLPAHGDILPSLFRLVLQYAVPFKSARAIERESYYT